MALTYKGAAKEYLLCKDKIDAIGKQATKDKAQYKEKMALLEQWFDKKAKQDGLENIKTDIGTGYWSTTSRCSVSSPEEFRSYVIAAQRWDLMETRASKKAVEAELEETGNLPPGVNFTTIRGFNFRREAPAIDGTAQ